MNKINVGVIGATGLVGQKLISLLDNHPWFDLKVVAASSHSAGKAYAQAVDNRWVLKTDIPTGVKELIVLDGENDLEEIANKVSVIFCAIDADKEVIKKLEENYASKGVIVISNNSAHRWTQDVPIILPEVNPDHLNLIDVQRKGRNWKGFIVVKPNCSIQSYVPVIKALESFKPSVAIITTLQAISGAGKTFETWPEMVDNVIPFIGGEEEKSEKEPLKVLGKFNGSAITNLEDFSINATCIRVPVSDGHMANVQVTFKNKISLDEVTKSINSFNESLDLKSPTSTNLFIKIFTEDNRPQTGIDRDLEDGMGISVGRIKQINENTIRFIGLSHNTIRGAAGGAILTAELLKLKNYL